MDGVVSLTFGKLSDSIQVINRSVILNRNAGVQ